MLNLRYDARFKKDYKKAVKRHYDIKLLEETISLLRTQRPLPKKYKDHQLTNSRNYKNARECHIQPDWLLIYRIHNNTLILELMRTGTHSDLFNKVF